MTLAEYIKQNYNSPYWFVSECEQSWHRDRIDNILNIKEYLSGKHAILSRPNEVYNGRTFKTKKIVLQYAKTILNFQTSFLLGKPATLSGAEGTIKELKNIYKKSKYNDIDYKILDKLTKYGEVYEYLYFSEDGRIKSKLINPEDGYPIYSDSMEYLAFIEHYTSNGISYWNVFTDNNVVEWTNAGGYMHKVGQYNNVSGLPVIYKTQNEEDERQGRSDLEDYVNILDNMEELISKYADSFYKFLNPIPVMRGTKLNIGKNGEGAINPDVVGYALQLDDNSDFNLITNRMDYKSLETIYNMLRQALLDISMTPSIITSGVQISNVSETSIKMLYSMAQIKAQINSKYLIDGFRYRWKLMQKMLKLQNIDIDARDVEVVFNMAIPQNDKEVIENLKVLNEIGAISLDSILSQSPYCNDITSEKEKIENNRAN
jgi:SPP1 family phage portal protein